MRNCNWAWLRWVSTMVLSLSAAAGAVLIAAPAASANNWFHTTGSTSCTNGNQADNDRHSIFYKNLTTWMVGRHNVVVTNRLDGVGGLTANVVTSETANTDAVQMDYDYAYNGYCDRPWHDPPSGHSQGSTVGHSHCVSLTGDNDCQKHEQRYDLSYINGLSNLDAEIIVLHELGHSVGFKHNEDDHAASVMGAEDGQETPYFVATEASHIAFLD